MHLLLGADDGVDRTGLDAFGATDADRLFDEGHGARDETADLGGEGLRRPMQQLSQREEGGIATRRTTVDVHRLPRYGFGVSAAIGIAAAGALGLRKQGIDVLDG